MSESPLEQRRRALASQIVEKIMNDPGFRQGVVNDTKGTLEAHGLWQDFTLVNEAYSNPDVVGFVRADSNCCGSNY